MEKQPRRLSAQALMGPWVAIRAVVDAAVANGSLPARFCVRPLVVPGRSAAPPLSVARAAEQTEYLYQGFARAAGGGREEQHVLDPSRAVAVLAPDIPADAWLASRACISWALQATFGPAWIVVFDDVENVYHWCARHARRVEPETAVFWRAVRAVVDVAVLRLSDALCQARPDHINRRALCAQGARIELDAGVLVRREFGLQDFEPLPLELTPCWYRAVAEYARAATAHIPRAAGARLEASTKQHKLYFVFGAG